ncbi:hypothetical protein FOA52_011683, partial [Chlamydomonas sp. UWO 241]
GAPGVEDGDWWALLHHVVAAGPGGRLHHRLLNRLAVIPLSHNHRFPLYEQLAGAARARDHAMHEAGLRVPPRFVATPEESEALLADVASAFQEEEGEVMAVDVGAGGGGGGGGGAGGKGHASHAAGGGAGFADALAGGGGSGGSGDNALPRPPQQHRAAYAARKVLPLVLARHALRTPGATTPYNLHAPIRPTVRMAIRQPVAVVDVGGDQLRALVPSLVGDVSAAAAAVIASLGAASAAPPGVPGASTPAGGPLHVDEALRAENAFLDVCDVREVVSRLHELSEDRAERFEYQRRLRSATSFKKYEGEREVEEEGDGPGATLSVANASGGPEWALSSKALEATAYLRFLRTKRNKLKALHYTNALVSLQLALLGDEAVEAADGADVREATMTSGEFTCPVYYARGAAVAAAAAAATGGGTRLAGDGGDKCDVASEFDESPAEAYGGGGGGARPRDAWFDDREAGVAVRDSQMRWVVYRRALELFSELEEEVLRTATYHLGQYTAQLAEAGREREAERLDHAGVLDDLWSAEASFCAARHRAILAYYSAYHHAEAWGVCDDLFGGLGAQGGPGGPCAGTRDGPAPTRAEPFPASGMDRWDSKGGGANSQQPQLLAARVQLRRELLDLCFRRPAICPEDGYFSGAYISATVSLELEAGLAEQLLAGSAQVERHALWAAHTAAAAAAQGAGSTPCLWRPGLPPALVYGGAVAGGAGADGGGAQRGLWREGCMLAGCGAAAAALPGALRRCVSALAEVHQVRHYAELAELRRLVLQSACVELGVLLREEGHRTHAAPARVPKDSAFKDSMGKGDPDAALLGSFNWLAASHVADAAPVVVGCAVEAGAHPRAAVEAALCRETTVRLLYMSEVAWLAYVVQSRALGRKLAAPELGGIAFDELDSDGQPRKPELLHESMAECEPFDIDPPGLGGPPGVGAGADGGTLGVDVSSTPAGVNSTPADGAGNGGGNGGSQLFGVGGAGCLGGVWRTPPIALAETSTQLAELLRPHSLAGLRAMLTPGGQGGAVIAAAATAQSLRAQSLLLALRHNQVLLDFVTRKLDRRRRVLVWRACAMDGVAGGRGGASSGANTGGGGVTATVPAVPSVAADTPVGRPPGAYAPAALAHHRPPAVTRPHEPRPPPLLAPPADERLPGLDKLDAKAVADLKACRRRLVGCAAPLWLDLTLLKLRLRQRARVEFVAACTAAAAAAVSSSGRFNGVDRAGGGGGGGGSGGGSAAATGAPVKLAVFRAYADATLRELAAAAVKLELAHTARQLAHVMLGSTGGPGANWGVQIAPDGRRTLVRPEPSPLFLGAEGAVRLEKMVLEYGPMWQGIDFESADKPGDPDPMAWQLTAAAIPTGFMFPSVNGCARIDTLWAVPSQWDCLGADCYADLQRAAAAEADGGGANAGKGPSELELLMVGARLGRALVSLVRCVLFEAALMAPPSELARGGDLSHQLVERSAGSEPTAHPSQRPQPLTGASLYAHVAACARAGAAPWLPGALIAPALVQLYGRLQHASPPPAPKGLNAGRLPPSLPQSMVPTANALALLQRDVEIMQTVHVVGVARARDVLAAARPDGAKWQSWHLAGALEHALARGCAVPEALPSLLEGAALRLPPADRIAIANEIARLSLLTERATHAAVPAPAMRPLAAQVVARYVLSGVWSHDRLRDALCWRHTLINDPGAYPLSPPSELHYLRRYHGTAMRLHPTAAPAPAAVRALFAAHYAGVANAARALQDAAEAVASERAAAGAGEETSSLRPPPDANAPGKPGWLVGCAVWVSQEARAIEAASAVMRAELDLQAVQVSLLRLSTDVAEMAGLHAAPDYTFVTQGHAGLAVGGAPSASDSQQQQQQQQQQQGRQNGEGAPHRGGASGAAHPDADGPSLSSPLGYSPLRPGAMGPHRKGAARAAAAATSPAVTALVRKLVMRTQRGRAPAAEAGGGQMVFELTADELTRWLGEAVLSLSAGARAAASALAASGAEERAGLGELAGSLHAVVDGMSMDVETFLKRQAIKVETQVADRAMALLAELQATRRASSRNLEDAKRAMETAYLEAQKQYGSRLDELSNALLRQSTNAAAMRADMHKATLEALLDVRREMLSKAFGAGAIGGKGTGEVARMLELEEALQVTQGEVLDMERAIVKIQTWFKMRSSAFQTACMREVIRARDAAEAMERDAWEAREAAEMLQEQLTSQLGATQADLEFRTAALVKADADLAHARASNKKLMAWKVLELPRTEALKLQLDAARSSREAAEEGAQHAANARRQAALERGATAGPPSIPAYTLRSLGDAGGSGGSSSGPGSPSGRAHSNARHAAAAGGGPGGGARGPALNARPRGATSDTLPGAGPPPQLAGEGSEWGGHVPLLPGGGEPGSALGTPSKQRGGPGGGGGGGGGGGVRGGGGGGSETTRLAVACALDAQQEELRGQVAALQAALRSERAAKNALLDRAMIHNHLHAGGSGDGSGATDRGAAAPNDGGGGGAGAGGAAAAAAAQQQHSSNLDVLSRRTVELQSELRRTANERDAALRTLRALRMAAPELVDAVGADAVAISGAADCNSGGGGGALADAGAQYAAPHAPLVPLLAPSSLLTAAAAAAAAAGAGGASAQQRQAATAASTLPSSAAGVPAAAPASPSAAAAQGSSSSSSSPRLPSHAALLSRPQLQAGVLVGAAGSPALLGSRLGHPAAPQLQTVVGLGLGHGSGGGASDGIAASAARSLGGAASSRRGGGRGGGGGSVSASPTRVGASAGSPRPVSARPRASGAAPQRFAGSGGGGGSGGGVTEDGGAQQPHRSPLVVGHVFEVVGNNAGAGGSGGTSSSPGPGSPGAGGRPASATGRPSTARKA